MLLLIVLVGNIYAEFVQDLAKTCQANGFEPLKLNTIAKDVQSQEVVLSLELILDADPGAVKKMFVGDFVHSIHSSVLNRLADTPYQSSILFVINVDDVNEYVSRVKKGLD